MGEKTAIAWTDATFNPWWGCTNVGPGCDACYAEAWAKRFGVLWGNDAPRRFFGAKHWNEPLKWNRKAEAASVRRKVFCASMADVFDNKVGQEHREQLWALIRATPWLEWQLVTKRIGNVVDMLPADWGGGYPNVWIVITVVNQAEADRDIPKLLATPARVRGLSIEPQLGPIDLRMLHYDGVTNIDALAGRHGLALGAECNRIDWVITGGESEQPGHPARPWHLEWGNALADQCRATGVPMFHKQMGDAPYFAGYPIKFTGKGADPDEWPASLQVREFPQARRP